MAGKPSLINWLSRTVTQVVDPARETRTDVQATAIIQEMFAVGTSFSIKESVARHGVKDTDWDIVRQKAYRRLVELAWKDGVLSKNEIITLDNAARLLALGQPTVAAINKDIVRDTFDRAFAKAVEDGYLDDVEFGYLQQIASHLNAGAADLLRSYFGEQCQQLLLGLLYRSLNDGSLIQEEWDRVASMAGRMGVSQHDLLMLAQPHTHHFLERVLADVKADERITKQEEATIGWLIYTLRPSTEWAEYAKKTIDDIRTLESISTGRLPSIAPPADLACRAGEIVHLVTSAYFAYNRRKRGETELERVKGQLVASDSRLVFTSSTKSFEVPYRSILSCRLNEEWLEVLTKGSNSGHYWFGKNGQVASKIIQIAIGRANQTIVARSEGPPSRHIPRDVRQRVWQTYGGQCAECASDQYLEFDHIIPVARGGGNTETNIQLLCRRCNLKKSDNI